MRRTLYLLAALCALAIGCSGGDDDDDDGTPTIGSFLVSVTCTGAACGLSGTLKIPVHEEECTEPVLLTVSVPAVTTSAGGAVTHHLVLERRSYCVEVWLDADANGSVSAGDAIASAGGITANAGPNGQLDFILDALQP